MKKVTFSKSGVRNIAFRIIESDAKKRRLIEKINNDYICLTDELTDDSMIFLVWDMLGLKKRNVPCMSSPDGSMKYGREYDGWADLDDMYFGVGGVVDGGIEINKYIDTIIDYAEQGEE